MSRLYQLLQLLEQDPQDAFLKYGIAMEHLGAGNRTEAGAWLTRTLQEHPSYPPTYYQLAKLTAQNGKLSEAVALLETGIQQAMAAKDHLTLREMRSFLSELREDME